MSAIPPKPLDAKMAKLRALRLARDGKASLPKRNPYPDKFYELSDRLSFGKHEGKTIEDVIEEDHGWIKFALENIANFHLAEDAEARYLEVTDPRRSR